MKLKEVERVLYFENFIVIEPGLTALKKYQLLKTLKNIRIKTLKIVLILSINQNIKIIFIIWIKKNFWSAHQYHLIMQF